MEFIKFENRDHVGIVTLSRQPVNAICLALYKEVWQLFEQLDRDPEVWVILLQSDAKHFSVGNDMKEFSIMDDDYMDNIIRANRAMFNCKKPIIGAVHGAVMGEGLAFACSCDILVASDDASFCLAEVNMGLCGTISECSLAMPVQLLRYMALTGNAVSAAEMMHHGAVFQVVERDKLFDAAWAIAQTIAGKPPLAVSRTKQALQNVSDQPVALYRNAPLEYAATNELKKTADHKEAYSAFLEKRAPVFKGE